MAAMLRYAMSRFVLVAALCVFSAGVAAIDANTATQEELETIRGIGPALSARIVEERARGPFRDLDDFQERVRGVGETNARAMHAAGLTVGAADATRTIRGQSGASHVARGGAAGDAGSGSDATPRVQYFAGNPREADATAGTNRAASRARANAREKR